MYLSIIQVAMMLELWKNHKNQGRGNLVDLIKVLQENQQAFGVQPLIVALQAFCEKINSM